MGFPGRGAKHGEERSDEREAEEEAGWHVALSHVQPPPRENLVQGYKVSVAPYAL
jgi:hypothetical protein